jgi:ribulose-5-phosphate 4-epimerase/fuculose-1-phosphate aldolase
MTVQKSVLVIGLDPTLIDFSEPGYPPGMDATKVFAGMKSSEGELTSLGYSVHTSLTELWRNCGVSCSEPTQAEAVRLHPYRGRCTNESKQLYAV